MTESREWGKRWLRLHRKVLNSRRLRLPRKKDTRMTQQITISQGDFDTVAVAGEHFIETVDHDYPARLLGKGWRLSDVSYENTRKVMVFVRDGK